MVQIHHFVRSKSAFPVFFDFFYLKHINIGKLTAIFILYFVMVEKKINVFRFIGGLAQLARVLALHARCHRFESDILHTKKREIKMQHLFSLTVIDVITAVKIYHVQGTIMY